MKKTKMKKSSKNSKWRTRRQVVLITIATLLLGVFIGIRFSSHIQEYSQSFVLNYRNFFNLQQSPPVVQNQLLNVPPSPNAKVQTGGPIMTDEPIMTGGPIMTDEPIMTGGPIMKKP